MVVFTARPKRLLGLALLLIAGCGNCYVGLADATVMINSRGCGTIVDVQPGESADWVTVLTAAHVVQLDLATVVFHKHNRYGFVMQSSVVHGMVTYKDAALDLALILLRVPHETVRVRAVRLAEDLPHMGQTLIVSATPGLVQTMLRTTMGGWLHEKGMSVGWVHNGASGGGVYNTRLELNGVIQMARTSHCALFQPITAAMLGAMLEESQGETLGER